ncbi:MAG TPA: Gfo/Idh/MocA family oxidoreductase [Verrucomicrobiae bacterium]|nr:Gfo/Idh/MocA family oxidoreductase [Verrucomicrobiae bacterium]
MQQIGVGIVGCGGVTLQNHIPGLAMCADAKVVALCDTDAACLERAARETGVRTTTNKYEDVIARSDVQAVIIATPNITHAPIAQAAIAAGKHVLCEKPIAMNYADALAMYRAAEAKGVRHMTAFTYRFVPAMRYLAHLVKSGALGQPYHFRSCRLQDWGRRSLGWRQVAKLAGTGELGDMLSHRIDFSQMLLGRMERLVANTKRYFDDRSGQASDLEDWVAILTEFANGATGVLESSKVATGRNESWRSQDYIELNGSDASFVFFTERWNELQVGKPGGMGLEKITIPKEFWAWPASPRDATQGDPLVTFRYDQAFEFIDAIRNQRPCTPSFLDGARAQAIMDAAVRSVAERRWVQLENYE